MKGFKDPGLLHIKGFAAQNQFAPTDAQPIRQHARMAGDPFVSQAQRGFMYAKHPEIAKRWEKETPAGKLPKHK
jgi:hypothetical protein